MKSPIEAFIKNQQKSTVFYSIALTAYFYVWDILPYYEDTPHEIPLPIVLLSFFTLLSPVWMLYLIVEGIRRRKVPKALIPYLVLVLYVARVFQGGEVATFRDSDMSVTSTLTVYGNGSFRLVNQYAQLCVEQLTGSTDVVGDTLFLRSGPSYRFNLLKLSKSSINGKYVVWTARPNGRWLPVDRVVFK